MGYLKGEETLEVLQNPEERGRGFVLHSRDSLGDQSVPALLEPDLPLCQPGLSQLSYLLGSCPCTLIANSHPGAPAPGECATLCSVSGNPAHLGRLVAGASWLRSLPLVAQRFLPRGPGSLFLRP